MVVKVTLYRMGILGGFLAPLLWAAAIIFCASLRPEYSHSAQYISELGERSSSTEFLMRYGGFVPTGLLHVAFAASLYATFKGSRLASFAAALLALNGLGRVIAGMFPCEVGCAGPRVLLSQKLHSIGASIGFLALIGAAILWGVFCKLGRVRRGLSGYSIASGMFGLIFLVLMMWSAEEREWRGLYERLSSGVLSMWVLVMAVWIWRGKASNGWGAG